MAATTVRRMIRRILAWGGIALGAVVVVAAVALYVVADTPWGHERVRRPRPPRA